MKKIVFEQKMLLDLLESVNEKLIQQPRNTELLKLRGLVYSLSDKYEEAIQEFIKVLDILPNDISAYFLKSESHLNLGEMALAKRDYFRAVFLERDGHIPEMGDSDFVNDQERKDIETVLENEKKKIILKYFSSVLEE